MAKRHADRYSSWWNATIVSQPMKTGFAGSCSAFQASAFDLGLLTSGATSDCSAGTASALGTIVTVAFPIWQDRISPLLDAATRLLVVTLRRGAELRRREILLGPQGPDALARSVAELKVDVLLCAALSEPLLRDLRKRGVRVRAHLCGEVDTVLRAFCSHRLAREEFRMPGCWGRDWRDGCSRRQARRLLKTDFKPTTASHLP